VGVHNKVELLKKASYGYWTAFAGLGLQLVGVIWDALQHHLDPSLTAREGVFSLTNPSHLLIVLGMGVAVAGVGWGMFLISGSGPGFRLFWAPIVAIGILGVLSLLTGGIAIATGGLSGSHEHQSEHSSITVDDPVLTDLKGVLATEGTTAALDRLEELAAEDESLERQSHHYVHELGKFSYSHYGEDAAKAFNLCDGRFAGGCYHGVVQGYFEANPDFETDELAGLCEGTIVDADATEILKYQCVHGLGHGLSISFDHDLQKTLRYCDALETERDRGSCYGGAFMENTMFAQNQRQGDTDQGTALIKEDDLQYPCDSVEDRYKQQCYFLQPATILLQNGRDVDGAFEECDKAPKPYVAACYKGMGRDISSLTHGDTDKSRDLCATGTDSYEAWCFEGVVTLLISTHWRTDEAVDFCAGVPTWARSRCFEIIGEMLPGLYADTASRNAECEKAKEEEWVTICRRSVDLGGPPENEML
jgi:hypothetical protein